ncbi:MAG TPA: hypothetical protein VH639_04755 [Bryobacteraceae bacterium]
MKLIFSAALLCAAGGALFAQTPVVNALVNNYSYVAPGLPNYAIAQGAIFDIFGSNLAGGAMNAPAFPLQTTLNGVTVNVTVSGVTKTALLYYVSPSQIDAILPSGTPLGTGQITVTNNGSTSAPAPIIVAQSAFGILTLANTGLGPAAAFDAQYNYLGLSNAANPGDTIILWGTGAGPVADDNVQSATTAPMEVDIGGLAAKIAYQGRSGYAGLDQLNVVVPAGVSGCYVSVVVRSGNIVSNFSSISVANSGRVCSDTSTGLYGIFNSSQLRSLAGKTDFKIGGLGLFKEVISTPALTIGGVTSPATTETIDTGSASFEHVTLPANYDPYVSAGSANNVASVGSCSVFTSSTDASSPPPSPAPPAPTPAPAATTVALNAGPFMNVTGPSGQKQMPFKNGAYSAQLGGGAGPAASPVFIPATGGTFTFDNGAGGPDLGPFSVHFPLNPVVFTNTNALATVNRSQDMTVTWTGGDQDAFVDIGGASYNSIGGRLLTGSFNCTAPAPAGKFTVPAAVLLALPPTGSLSIGGITVPLSTFLSLANFSVKTDLTLPGLDLTLGYTMSIGLVSTTFQ